jgi:hypothetical protein
MSAADDADAAKSNPTKKSAMRARMTISRVSNPHRKQTPIDCTCRKSWPHAIFVTRKNGHARRVGSARRRRADDVRR